MKDRSAKKRAPKLDMSLNGSVVDTPNPQNPTVRHLRIRIRNDGKTIAKSCRVFLIDLVRLHGTTWVATDYEDAIELIWAYGWSKDNDHLINRDLAPGINYHVDLCHAEYGNKHIAIDLGRRTRHRNILDGKSGTYRITVQASADDTEPIVANFQINWTGEPSTLTIQNLG